MNFVLNVYIFIFFRKFAIAKSLLTFMVANTLYIDEMRTFSVDIVAFILCGCL